MDNISELLPILNPILEGLGKHFGINCEFVIHDYQSENLKTIVSIVNGNVTNRQIGDSVTSIGLRVSQGITANSGTTDGIFNYMTQTKAGRILKSSTIYLRDSNKNIIGSLCVNYDITDLQRASTTLLEFLNTSDKESLYDTDKYVDGNIDNLLLKMIKESIDSVGIPVSQMTKKNKMEGIKILRDRGALKIQRAVDVIAKYYCVSKFTIYNYINELDSMDYPQNMI
ncbi:MAG: transcriptional regulator [Lawsonibacter sp.]|nr:transcriptional regulator [Lawsonibacter sp.]